jgi:DNA polymerase-3 subunit epsilon
MRNLELCTVDLARRLIRQRGGHNLDALADHFGFEINGRHRAAGDAQATARLLLHLLDQLEISGVRTLAEARRFRADVISANQPNLQLALDV